MKLSWITYRNVFTLESCNIKKRGRKKSSIEKKEFDHWDRCPDFSFTSVQHRSVIGLMQARINMLTIPLTSTVN